MRGGASSLLAGICSFKPSALSPPLGPGWWGFNAVVDHEFGEESNNLPVPLNSPLVVRLF